MSDAYRTGLPRGLLAAGCLFWGWQSSNLLAGIALGVILEAPLFTRFRLEFSDTDYRRISDFSAVLLSIVVALLLVNRGTARGVLASLQWFPVTLAPLLLAQRLGPSGYVRMSALFHYLRRQLKRDPAAGDPQVDLAGPYLALIVVSAGAANLRGPGYYAGVVALTAWALYSLRPRSAAPLAFAAALAAGTAAGYAGQAGLVSLQVALEEWIDEWFVILPNDSQRTQTRIGSIGRIKQHDTIALRLYAPESLPPRLKLLHTASFNDYRNGAWFAREAVNPPAPQRPFLDENKGAIVLRVQGGRTLLPLPPGALEVLGLAGLPMSESGLGVVATDTQRGWLRYEFSWAERDTRYAAPGPADLALPPAERLVLERVAGELGLAGRAPPAAIAALQRHFLGFAYSTFRERGPAEGMTGLADFLLNARSGHCEYFASATTLLLRAAGIPARYATGYAVIEHSRLEKAWVVRARHAHAWTRAWVGGRWVDVDLTPPSWPEAEAELAPPWERMLDLLRWAGFRWSTREEGDTSTLWWVAAALLTVILAWRIVRQRRTVRLEGEAAAAVRERRPGDDSEFYLLEPVLAARTRARSPHEPLQEWFVAVEERFDEDERRGLRALLGLHQRYRFDPQGLSPEERVALGRGVRTFLSAR